MEASATKMAALENSPFQPVTQEDAEALSQTVLEMMPIYGSIESTLQLLTGKSSLTGEEVDRYVAALGLIPFAGTIRKAGAASTDLLSIAIKNSRVVIEPVYKTTREAAAAAKALGFVRINELSQGQAVFKKGGMYITKDNGGHIGGAWKAATSVKNLGSETTRLGTFDVNLERIGK